eukprot:Skav215087  [mRNA]  locus=scaffold1068:58304:68342:+ [translate_table: standard]
MRPIPFLSQVRSAQHVLNSSSFLQRPSLQKLQVLASRHADRLSDRAAKQLSAFLQDPATDPMWLRAQELQESEKENKAAYEKLIQAKRCLTSCVKEKCAAKEKAWEQRQQTRADETQAVSKAIEVLDSESSHELFGKTMKPSLIQLASKEDASVASKTGRMPHLLQDPSSEMFGQLPSQSQQPGSQYGRLRDLLPALRGNFQKFGKTKLKNWEAVLGTDLGQAKVQEKIDTMVAALKKEQANEVKKKDLGLGRWMAADGKKRQGEGLDAAVEEGRQ